MEAAPPNGQIEVAAAAVLAAAALATSWASYQAALWDGEQAASYSRAEGLRVEAASSAQLASARASVDVGLFTAWLNAWAGGDERLAGFYAARFPPAFRPAFDAWVATGPLTNPHAPPSPFAMPIYRPTGASEAKALKARAAAEFERGQRDNDISDNYVQAAAILAMALFFGGIGQVFRRPRVRIALVVLALAATAFGVLRILTLPAMSPV